MIAHILCVAGCGERYAGRVPARVRSDAQIVTDGVGISAQPGRANGQRRPRPKPTRANPAAEPRARRRLGRFFEPGQPATDEPSATLYPEHFPGVPRPELIAPEPTQPADRPRPGPGTRGRPRPGAKHPQPR
jgi:hypothetical protein